MIKRVYIAETPIDAVDVSGAAEWVYNRFKAYKRTKVAPINAAVIDLAAKNEIYKKVLEEFDLVIADGFWPALAATLLYRKKVPHTNTLPFIRNLIKRFNSYDLKVFLLGAKSNIVEKASINLKERYPNINVVGFENGFFHFNDEKDIVEHINKSETDILLLGMSSPKKEYFIHRNWDILKVRISVGVGGLFDIWGGGVKEAPTWIRACGFEWLFRLLQEPRRLLRRYTITNIRFIKLVIRQAFSMDFRNITKIK